MSAPDPPHAREELEEPPGADAPSGAARLPADGVPSAVRGVAETFVRAGFGAWLVGESLLALLAGRSPEAFELSTSASLEETLALFDAAVPTQATLGIATVPVHGASVDVVPFQCEGGLEDDLAGRDFTVLAMAWAPCTEEFVDPHGGRDDLRRGLLRTVAPATSCVGCDPARALRAARLVATYGLEVDPELEEALPSVGSRLKQLPAGRARSELVRLLLAERPSAGLELLRRTGLERRYFKPVRGDAAALVDAVPAILHLRMAAWLRGAKTSRTLRHLRFGVERSRRIERMLAHHPLDEVVPPSNDRSLSRLLRQLPDEDIEALFRMRAWELERVAASGGRVSRPGGKEIDVADARKRLDAVRRGIERVVANRARSAQRLQLALDGGEVMQLLACPPGPRVGAAIRYLTEQVRADPALNEPTRLREALLAWSAAHAS